MAALRYPVVSAQHDLPLAALQCHRVPLLQGGSVFAGGRPQSVSAPEYLVEGYGVHATVAQIRGCPLVVPMAPIA